MVRHRFISLIFTINLKVYIYSECNLYLTSLPQANPTAHPTQHNPPDLKVKTGPRWASGGFPNDGSVGDAGVYLPTLIPSSIGKYVYKYINIYTHIHMDYF